MYKFGLVSIFILASFLINGQEYYGANAKKIIANSSVVKVDQSTNSPEYIRFEEGKELTHYELVYFLRKIFNLPESMNWILINSTTDNMGEIHNRFRLQYAGYNLHEGMFITHERNGKIYAINGNIPSHLQIGNSIKLNETEALNLALQEVGAQIYKWQIKEEESFVKELENNEQATWFPKGSVQLKYDRATKKYNYTWVFDIYAHSPMSRADYFVDAQSGKIVFVNNKIHHSDSLGSAATKFSGTKPIITDYNNSNFRLRESGRGNGIETYNMQTSTNYGSAVDFTDSDNYWNNVNTQKDEVATDAHWGMEMTYDYFFNHHNRNSIDGNGFKLKSYVHYDVAYANAFWNGQYMTFGDGNSSMLPLVALDIVGHEISHGLTTYTADLDYQDESGAMNEAYSDIFGTAIEHYCKTGNWLIGEDIGTAMRSMSNPKSKGDPDTYLGQNYYIGTADNGGVHTNSGVLNHWFYLTSEGGQGTNDNNDSYNVVGVGIDTAGAIAFRTLTVYLVNTSDHADCRFYSIQSAMDLYGACSNAVKATTAAFYAVGIGSDYIPGVQADFMVAIPNYCTVPAQVSFKNLSNNAINFAWNFGDGQTSTAINPNHTYTNYGSYNVQLIAFGGNCGLDTVVKSEFISVDSANPCITNIPPNGMLTINSCSGTVLDNGGLSNYSTNSNSTLVIAPIGASQVKLTFTAFSFESNYDFLKIYDGASIQSPLIGSFSGNALPNGGVILSTSNALTLVQTSDQAINDEGFIANFECILPSAAPVADFVVSDSVSCSGSISFFDQSSNGPIAWEWDFGDGNISTLRNPVHTYLFNGVYSVTLKSTNVIGNHTVNKMNYVVVDKLYAPAIPSVSVCNTGNVDLIANNNSLADMYWYASQSSQTPLHVGDTFNVGTIVATQIFYAELIRTSPVFTAGRPTNGGGGGNLTATHGLYFDSYQPFVLESVNVYATSAGNRTISLKNSLNQVIATKTVSVVNGINTVILDFNVPLGNDFLLEGENLFRNNANVSFPYVLQNYLSINRSTAGTAPLDYYYYFYNWKVRKPNCVSDRVPVSVFVNSAPPIADFSMTNNDPYVDLFDISTNKGSVNWTFGDGGISYLNDPTHVYLQNGTYQITMNVDNGCGTDSKVSSVTINSATGISTDISDDLLEIYPNPANENINIKFSESHEFSFIGLYDFTGKIIKTISIYPNQTDIMIQISELSSGIYFLRFTNLDRVISRKFIVD